MADPHNGFGGRLDATTGGLSGSFVLQHADGQSSSTASVSSTSSNGSIRQSPLDLLGATAEEELSQTNGARRRSAQSRGRQDGQEYSNGGGSNGNGSQGHGLSSAALHSLGKQDPSRVRMQSLIEHELRMRYPFREDWQRKCKEMAWQLEEVLFRNAKSLDEYRDESTLSLRLVEIFMAKKKRELSKSHEENDELYTSVLDKARTRWLTGEEIVVLLMKCSRKMPCLLMMNDTAFLPTSGSVFHFGSAVLGDGYGWLKAVGTNLLQEHRFILTVGGQPKVWVSLNVDIQRKMHRRTYWLADNISIGVLVHYLSETPVVQQHTRNCFCLACLFQKEHDEDRNNNTGVEGKDGTEDGEDDVGTAQSKRSRND